MTDSWGRPEGAGRGGAGVPVYADGGEPDAVVFAGGAPVPRQAESWESAERQAERQAQGPRGSGDGRARRRSGVVARGELPGAVPALVLVCLPLVGALVGRGAGPFFVAGALLGAVPAALLCTRRGVWWVATGAPPVVLLMSLFGHLVTGGGASAGSTALATHLVAWVAGAFPVMGLAAGGAAAVGAGRFARSRWGSGSDRG